MTDLDLQRRCAELAGWTDLKYELIYGAAPEVLTGVRDDVRKLVPDYPDDLNAVRELMALIPQDDDFGSSKQTEFADRLWRITGGALFDLLMATPEQICRAFVKVMS